MGATISVCNYTNLILNICLKQAFPLYINNQLLPGQNLTRNVGKVWFTIEAKVWNGENDYNSVNVDKIISWIAIGAKVGGATKRIMHSETNIPTTEKTAVYQSGNTYITFNKNDLSRVSELRQWLKRIVSKKGVYGKTRKIAITGGPKANITTTKEGRLIQIIDATKPFKNFKI
jgi:hypothetical protein